MATNLKSILDAMATGPYLPATLNAAKLSGAESIRKTYPQAPDSLPSTPAIVFLPQTGEIVEAGAGTYSETHEVDIWFVYAYRQGDLERAETQRQLWVGPLNAALLATTARLALTASVSIKSALPQTYEFDTIPYSGADHPGIRWRIQINIRDITVPA
jgi:hypothetical protein